MPMSEQLEENMLARREIILRIHIIFFLLCKTSQIIQSWLSMYSYMPRSAEIFFWGNHIQLSREDTLLGLH